MCSVWPDFVRPSSTPDHCFAYVHTHTTLKTPVLVRASKLSKVGPCHLLNFCLKFNFSNFPSSFRSLLNTLHVPYVAGRHSSPLVTR